MKSFDEWLKQFKWSPPVNNPVVEIQKFYDIHKGKIVIISIDEYPQDFSKLIDWVEYRKQINKPLIIYRTYLTKVKDKVIAIKMHEDSYPVYISLTDLSVYVERHALIKSYRVRTALRYILYYSGYKLKYKYTHIPANKYTGYKSKQTNLCIF